MGRFRSKLTGSVVNVSDEQAKQLGDEYESADKKASAPAPRKRAASKPSAGSDDE